MNKFNLGIKAKAVDKAFREGLQMAAKEAKTAADKAFQNEGFTDEALIKWKPRKGKFMSLGASANARLMSDLTRPTLTGKTKRLKRSNHFRKIGAYTYRVFNDTPYAAAHNYGLIVHGHRMPQRRFIGHSKKLSRFAMAKMKARIKTYWKNA